ncbi:MAG: enoyl-ACP reductase [Planctomycetota bacterium]|nr:MAG: enoyl-ACP reductase [Planctomycetota bacterium]
MGFLNLKQKVVVIFGVANKKSVAWAVAKTLMEESVKIVYVVRSQERKDFVLKQDAEAEVYICDVEHNEQIINTCNKIKENHKTIHGLCHSIAFANYDGGFKAFHETSKNNFLQSVDISCFSLISICNELKDNLDNEASVVTISISTTRMAAENYGYMAPVKAALNSTTVFLAKSFSEFSKIRFNAVCAGLLKTSASAGIPGYVESYLFAEQATLRKKALQTDEVADTVTYLLSPRSSGINAQEIVIDAGMSVNYFDKELVHKAVKI